MAGGAHGDVSCRRAVRQSRGPGDQLRTCRTARSQRTHPREDLDERVARRSAAPANSRVVLRSPAPQQLPRCDLQTEIWRQRRAGASSVRKSSARHGWVCAPSTVNTSASIAKSRRCR